MDTDRLGYVSYRLAPRPARVAIVVSGDENWRYWCRLALHGASHTWGGAGFVLVPHVNGVVHPLLLQGVSAYDPDYVMLQQRSLGDVETLDPGSVRIAGPEDTELSPDQRAAIVKSSAQTPLPDPAGDEARRAVVAACSPHRRWDEMDARWDEEFTWWSADPTANGFAGLIDLGLDLSEAMTVPPDAPGNLAVALTARVGAVDPPDPRAAVAADKDSPAGVPWLIDRIGLPPSWWTPGDESRATAFDVSRTGLAPILSGAARPAPTLVAAGDTAADFALALLWDRLYGSSLWLPRDWWPTATSPLGESVARALRQIARTGGGRGRTLQFASATACEEELDALVQALSEPDGGAGLEAASRRQAVTAARVTWPRRGSLHLAVADQFDQQFALPVRRDDEGGIEMAAPPPPPVISHPALAGQEKLRWEVDLQPERTDMPSGRGLNGHALLVDDDDAWLTWVRSGRDGTTYNAQRYDFVAAGASPEAKLARPRLRELGLLAWANALGKPQGRNYRLSDAGLRVQILTRMAGGRPALVDSLVGPLRGALRSFNAEGKSTAAAYPQGEGVALPDGGYRTLAGMASLADSMQISEVRERVDVLLCTGILRRGTILGCAACQRPSFVLVDALRQLNACPRCGHVNDLVQDRWRSPAEEPAWYYDLHPAARELFSQHGDVPLLLSGHLRQRSRRYADIAEVELVDHATGKGLAEADLLAHADSRVITAEAKSNSVLGESSKKVRDAASKRALLAHALGADEVVLATTADTWATASLDAMRTALTALTWPRGAPPVLRAVIGLGTDAPDDSVIDLANGQKTPYPAI